MQKLVNAYVDDTASGSKRTPQLEIAAKMPADYYSGTGMTAYVAALDSEKGIYNPTGIMPLTVRQPA